MTLTRFPVECNSDLGNRVTPYRVLSLTGSGRIFHLAIQPGRQMITHLPVEYNCNLFNRVITYLKPLHCLVLPGPGRIFNLKIAIQPGRSDDAFFPAEFIFPVNGSCLYSNGSVLPNLFYMRQGISTFQLYFFVCL